MVYFNTGFAEVAVTFRREEVPGTGGSGGDVFGEDAYLNISLPDGLNAGEANRLFYFRGDTDAPGEPRVPPIEKQEHSQRHGLFTIRVHEVD